MSDTDEQKTVEARLAEWAQQPGAVVTEVEWKFIEDMRRARLAGVGYGWMQQVIEWEWQSKGPGAFGPNYFHKMIEELEAKVARIRAMLRSEEAREKVAAAIWERFEKPYPNKTWAWVQDYRRDALLAKAATALSAIEELIGE